MAKKRSTSVQRLLFSPEPSLHPCDHLEPELRCIYEKDLVLLPALDAAGLLIRG
jgi:hypothetical protein